MPACGPRLLGSALVLLLFGACDRVTTIGPAGPGFVAGDPALGRVAFATECAGCHATRDGFDLAFFGFAHETVFERAAVRVDSTTAQDIVAWIASLDVPPREEAGGLFQPGGRVLADDEAFARGLFGEDAWPKDLDTEEVLALDPAQIPVAFSFPPWSASDDNVHWIPESPLDEQVLGHREGAVRTALETYYRTGSQAALVETVNGLRAAERDAADPDAACVTSPLARFDPERCFETRRWVGSLGAQFLLRSGGRERFERVVHDSWWDVGDAARWSVRRGAPVDDALRSWVQWMYLGWAWEPARHSSVPLADGLAELGLPRHAAFHAARAMVARSAASPRPYEDASTLARFAPDAWLAEAMRFAYRHLLDRLEREERPTGDARTTAVYHTLVSYHIAAGRLESGGDRKELRKLRDRILETLD